MPQNHTAKKYLSVTLPNGELINAECRTSFRAKRVRLQISPGRGLVVTLPAGADSKWAEDFLHQKTQWIMRHLDLLENSPPVVYSLPEQLVFPCLAETWQLSYQELAAADGIATIRIAADSTHQLELALPKMDRELGFALLRQWLKVYAYHSFLPMMMALSKDNKLPFGRLSIRNQDTRWGSCSAQNNISLSCRLLFLERDLVECVMLHELAHTREHNHSPSFWKLLRRLKPDADALHQEIREKGKNIPTWVSSSAT